MFGATTLFETSGCGRHPSFFAALKGWSKVYAVDRAGIIRICGEETVCVWIGMQDQSLSGRIF